MFTLTGIDKFTSGIAAWIKKTEQEVEEVYSGYVSSIYLMLLRETPQWTGNAVSNWNIGVGSPDFSFSTTLLHESTDPRVLFGGTPENHKGHLAAQNISKARNAGRTRRIKLKSGLLPDVYLTNSSKNLEGVSYLHKLESNPSGFLRSVNEPGHMVARTKDFYSNLGSITKATQTLYRSMHI